MTAEPTHALARLFCHVNRAVMKVTEAVAVLLVVAETLILLAGVISRYGFDNPLTWSDELAQILFIWLSMLGAVLALDRGEHMRLSAIVNKLPVAWREWFQTMAALTVCVFVALIIMPAYTHAIEQMDITTPALEIPDGLRAAALPVGAGLMLIAAISRLARCSSMRQLGLGVLVVAALAGGAAGVVLGQSFTALGAAKHGVRYLLFKAGALRPVADHDQAQTLLWIRLA